MRLLILRVSIKTVYWKIWRLTRSINPHDVGIDDNSIVLTARSGRAALKHRFSILGVELSQDKLDSVYEEFLKLADRKKDIHRWWYSSIGRSRTKPESAYQVRLFTGNEWCGCTFGSQFGAQYCGWEVRGCCQRKRSGRRQPSKHWNES